MSGWKLPQVAGVEGLTYSARVQYHTPRERELYAHARAEALEEAAKQADQCHAEGCSAESAAIHIRALKDPK